MKENNVFQGLKVKRDNLKERLANSLEDLILSSNMKSGSRLPTERELSKMLGVNRATVSEAISLLEYRGLITRRQGSGTYVNSFNSTVLEESIERFCIYGDISLQEVALFRCIVEPEIAALAAQNATEEDVKRLKELSDKIIAYHEESTSVIYDSSFHHALAMATHHSLIAAIVLGIHRTISNSIRAEFFGTARNPKAENHHRLIYEAVRDKDPVRARRIMRAHMKIVSSLLNEKSDFNFESVLSSLGEDEEETPPPADPNKTQSHD